jgi:hypothetical protein
MKNRLPKVPAHLISLSGERTIRMRVDPGADRPLAAAIPVAPGERRPFATIDLESLRASVQIGMDLGL